MRHVRARWRTTDRGDGDLAVGSPGVEARRRAVVDLPWTWLRQVHGAHVVTVRHPGDGAGVEADGAVTAAPGAVLAVQVADCAPVALLGSTAVGVAHAGWRGLEQGILPATVDALRALGATEVRAVVGPCIRAECYEFGPDLLDGLAGRFGDGVRGRSADGAPALDLVEGVRASLAEAGVRDVTDVGTCTSCAGERHWSHRARGERQRQALLVWLEEDGPDPSHGTGAGCR